MINKLVLPLIISQLFEFKLEAKDLRQKYLLDELLLITIINYF